MGDAREPWTEHAHVRVRARRRARRGGNDDARALPVAVSVVLYGADECHLCERARATLEKLRGELGFDLREVNITGDAALEARYREWLPVVEIDGERAFVYSVPEEDFRARLARAQSHRGSGSL